MARTKRPNLFNTSRRIRLGIWGLGRGMNFYRSCELLNIDVVAGCDFNRHMREQFSRQCPGALVTDKEEEFLAADFDAVLLATYCPDHAGHAIKCLRAGKHVLSEVTAFYTLAEGVRLVEAVEKSGKVYNLAENYPFSPINRWLAGKWREGLFGDLMYAEFEYVHECRSLCYTYIDGVPVRPGNLVHNWRSWINYHYYCTHSLGPVMVITGTRPVRVTALPGRQKLAGYILTPPDGMGGVAPSLINMSNGGIVRNLMGATTNDSHVQRIWGTLGSAEQGLGAPLRLRLGGSGGSPKLEVRPEMDDLDRLAASTGHGGGDFWVLYYFVREILTGEQAPFDVYAAADVTIPGILALRSSLEGGRPYDVPDFRRRADRDKHRDDHWAQERYPQDGAFPKDADTAHTQHFSRTMTELVRYSLQYRAYADWWAVRDTLAEPARLREMLDGLIADYPKLRDSYSMARWLIDAYPGSDGARVLREMLEEVGQEREVLADGFLAKLKRRRAAMKKKPARWRSRKHG